MLFTSTSSYEPKALSSTDKMVFLAVIAASVVGFLGFQYYQSKNKPFNLYEKAKRSYDVADPKLLNFFERYNSEKSDIAALASSIYLKPSRSLADLMLALEAAQRDLKPAMLNVDTALLLLKEECFVSDCTYLKNKLQERLVLIEDLIVLIHDHSLWSEHYPIYAQLEKERIAKEREAFARNERQTCFSNNWDNRPFESNSYGTFLYLNNGKVANSTASNTATQTTSQSKPAGDPYCCTAESIVYSTNKLNSCILDYGLRN